MTGTRVFSASGSASVITPAPLDVDLIGLSWGPPEDVDVLLAPVERIQAASTRTVAAMKSPAARAFLAATTPTRTYGIKTGFVTGSLSAEANDFVHRGPGPLFK